MKTHIHPRTLLLFAMTAVVSLACVHLGDLVGRLLGSAPASEPAVIGDIASLLGCTASAVGMYCILRFTLCRGAADPARSC
jgi:hypothetical protein